MKSSPGRTPPFRRAKKETLIQLQCVLIMQANDTIMMGHGWTVNTHSNSLWGRRLILAPFGVWHNNRKWGTTTCVAVV